MSYLSVDNLIGVQPTTTSSTLLQANIVDVYNGTTNYTHITSASTAAPNNLIIPDANGEFVATTGNQTVQSKMFHSRKTSSFDPVYSFLGDTQTGMYWAGTNKIGFGTDAIEQLVISTIDIVSILPIKSNQFRSNSAFGSGYGTAGNVVYGLDGGANGMYFGLNRINFSTNSAERLNIQNTYIQPSVPLRLADGGFVFSNSTNTGITYTGSNRIVVSNGGVQTFSFANGGLNQSLLPTQVPVGSASAVGLCGAGYTSTGLYWTAGPILNVSVSGTQRAAFESGGLKLYGSTAGNNALYVPSGLQYYEEFSLSGSWFVNGSSTAGASSVVYLTRIGRMMYITINQFGDGSTTCINNTGVNQTEIYYSLSIPTRALSAIFQQSATSRIFWGATGSVISFFYITAAGVIRGSTVANTALPNGQAAYINTPFTISYPIV